MSRATILTSVRRIRIHACKDGNGNINSHALTFPALFFAIARLVILFFWTIAPVQTMMNAYLVPIVAQEILLFAETQLARFIAIVSLDFHFLTIQLARTLMNVIAHGFATTMLLVKIQRARINAPASQDLQAILSAVII